MASVPAASHPERRGRPRTALLAGAPCESIRLDQIRSEHPLFQQALQRLHPRPIDDSLTLTAAAIQILCTLHPLVVRSVGRGRHKGYEVLAGLLAWRVLRPHHALHLAAQPASTAGQAPDAPPADTQESAPPPTRIRHRKSAPLSTLPAGFRLPVMVLPGGMSDADIEDLLFAERWLQMTSVGPLKALNGELAQLQRQGSMRGWIDDLTPHIKNLSALARVLGVSRQTLAASRRSMASSNHEPPNGSTDRD